MSPHRTKLVLDRPGQTASLLALLTEEAANPSLSDPPTPGSPAEALLGSGLFEPLASFLRQPGKGLRGELVTLAWQLADRSDEPPDELALIVEALHAGSLIIDDVQDGSTTRRGMPSLHEVTGTPLAINAGNWLYFWPLSLLERMELCPARQLELHRVITNTILCCHYGQTLDLTANVHELAPTEIGPFVLQTTRWKTGALTRLAVLLGAVAAGAAPERQKAIADLGTELGIALQMLNDMQDLRPPPSDPKRHEDLASARPTWPWAWLAAAGDAELRAWREEATRIRATGGDWQPFADRLARAVRPTARRAARRHLAAGVAAIREAVGPEHPAVPRLESLVQRMEERYGG